MTNKTAIIFCHCSANVISEEKFFQLQKALRKLETDIFELSDLCAFSQNEHKRLHEISNLHTNKVIVACYPRAVKNIIKQAKVEFGAFEVLNFKELSIDEISLKLTSDFNIQPGEARYQTQKSNLNVPAWFPVIDMERCTHCGKCARFCLFGVYGFGNKKLTVENPLACKNKCPACGRTCPSSAIIFPRMEENTVLAGADPHEINNTTRENQSLLVLLNERNQSRRTIFKTDVVKLAQEERRKALEEIKSNNKE